MSGERLLAGVGDPAGGTREREQRLLGQEAAPELIIAYGGRVPSDQLQSYVTDIGMKLAAKPPINISSKIKAMNATIGDKSIMPMFGNKRRNGANNGSANS